ncbi:uncharacterized protein LOC135699565 [Ochlerotatus camptorhynchus]|uniref:uncharacterized protein LOC135699565 n=1 Tax=Ochlerotatus camptorhynchus TaxID=644619 RepID=UPI0031D3055F
MPPKRMLVCAVRGCSRGPVNIETTTCHRFPLEVGEAAEWVRFSQNAYAEHQFKLAGPIGVRKLWICSQHFEPSCYKVPGTKTTLKYGAMPTLNEACDEPADPNETPFMVACPTKTEAKKKNEKATSGIGEDTEETLTDVEMAGSSPGTAGVKKGSHKRKNYRRASDRFFDFLMDDDDDDDDDLDLDLRQVANKIRKEDQPAPLKRKIPSKHGQFCLCNSCRKERSAKAMEKAITPNKSTQTEDRGPQPVASPVPAEVNQDSCRLCFSTDQLEPLCSGMIVVRDEMLDKIYVCTGILIIPRPKESIFICTPCAQLINSFHSYRQQVCSNNRALQRFTARKIPVATVAVKVRKTAPPVTPLTRKRLPVTPAVRKVPAPLPLVSQYRKIAPKVQLPMMQPEITIEPSVLIKTEPEDPLEGCGEPALKIPPAVPLPAKIPTIALIKMPAPKMETELKKEPVPETGLLMEAEEGSLDLPEQESWKCWQCENSFLFQFECAKHMMQVHGEKVAYIKQRMNLDELNANMLEMMSAHQRK